MHAESADPLESLESRHDVVRGQLALIDGWVERLPLTNLVERRSLMGQIVEFLQRYVLADAVWEERHLFPRLGAQATILKAEHRFIKRWVTELGELTQTSATLDGVQFRRTTYKLLGLLEAHMDMEENLVLDVTARRADRCAAELG